MPQPHLNRFTHESNEWSWVHGYPSTWIFMYFQILATYFWLDLYILTDFFRTCKYPSPEDSKYFRSTKNLYVCERFLEQIQHILCTPVTMVGLLFFINNHGGPIACHMGHIGLRSQMAMAPSLNMPLHPRNPCIIMFLSHRSWALTFI